MIHPPNWTADQSKATLGALRAIATLHGTEEMSPSEAQLIEGVRINIFRHPELTDAELNVLTTPADLAAAIQDDEHKRRAAELIMLMPYAARPYTETKKNISERLLQALGEDVFELEDFLGARQKHSTVMEYCALRKMGRDVLANPDPNAQSALLQKMLKEAEGNADVLARYQALKGYPDGSLGRAYFNFYTENGWPLPGDPLWIPEDMTVRHDLVHLLCDYDISINGEFCVAGFTAGNSENFNWMIATLGFTPPYVSTGADFNPADFAAAYARGDNAIKSFVDDWDFWPEMEEQVTDLRKQYQI